MSTDSIYWTKNEDGETILVMLSFVGIHTLTREIEELSVDRWEDIHEVYVKSRSNAVVKVKFEDGHKRTIELTHIAELDRFMALMLVFVDVKLGHKGTRWFRREKLTIKHRAVPLSPRIVADIEARVENEIRDLKRHHGIVNQFPRVDHRNPIRYLNQETPEVPRKDSTAAARMDPTPPEMAKGEQFASYHSKLWYLEELKDVIRKGSEKKKQAEEESSGQIGPKPEDDENWPSPIDCKFTIDSGEEEEEDSCEDVDGDQEEDKVIVDVVKDEANEAEQSSPILAFDDWPKPQDFEQLQPSTPKRAPKWRPQNLIAKFELLSASYLKTDAWFNECENRWASMAPKKSSDVLIKVRDQHGAVVGSVAPEPAMQTFPQRYTVPTREKLRFLPKIMDSRFAPPCSPAKAEVDFEVGTNVLIEATNNTWVDRRMICNCCDWSEVKASDDEHQHITVADDVVHNLAHEEIVHHIKPGGAFYNRFVAAVWDKIDGCQCEKCVDEDLDGLD